MEITTWPIDRPKPYAKNARNWTPSAIGKVAASIQEFGFRQPIVVDSEGCIIIGHLRLAASKQLGLREIPVHVAADLSPDQVKALRLADNRTHEEAEWNPEFLGAEFLELKLADFDLEMTAFDGSEILEIVFADMPRNGKKKGKAKQQSAGLEFKVIVDCVDEHHQTELLGRFQEEGLQCRALIS